MKNFYSFIALFLVLSCSNDDTGTPNKSIFGSWQLVERYGSDGADGLWWNVNNGYIYDINDDQSLESSEFNCDGTFDMYEDEKVRITFDCDDIKYDGYFVFDLSQDILILTIDLDVENGCIEGCAEKFRRID